MIPTTQYKLPQIPKLFRGKKTLDSSPLFQRPLETGFHLDDFTWHNALPSPSMLS